MQWLMLQQIVAEDYVIATGKQHSVREFVELAAKEIGITIEWRGQDEQEKGFNATTGQCIVEVSPRYFRPTEVDTLLGDATKAKTKLDWTPKISFEELVAEMIHEDLKEAQREQLDTMTKNHQTQKWDPQGCFKQMLSEIAENKLITVEE